jgi:hypothetical protein
METKKARVTKITKMDKKDTYGNTSYIIELDSGDKGFYSSKDENQKKFIVGNVADYQIEEKQGSKGPYFKITVPGDAAPKFGKPQIDPRVSMISYAGSYVKDLVVAGKVELKDYETQFNKMYTLFISKL